MAKELSDSSNVLQHSNMLYTPRDWMQNLGPFFLFVITAGALSVAAEITFPIAHSNSQLWALAQIHPRKKFHLIFHPPETADCPAPVRLHGVRKPTRFWGAMFLTFDDSSKQGYFFAPCPPCISFPTAQSRSETSQGGFLAISRHCS